MPKTLGAMGEVFDDGAYTGVRKVYVTYSFYGISHIMVDYDKAGKVVTLQNGDIKGENRVQGQQSEFVLDYPNEYITSVEGTCDLESGRHNRVRSLSFKTSKERTSPTYGNAGKQNFVLESKGRALVGFHGRAGWAIDAIGAYFGPPPAEKLRGKRVDGGASWDDDGVRKIYMGQGESFVSPLLRPIPSPVAASTLAPIRLEYQGGSGGNQWDHGPYTGIKKVYVTYSPSGISHIMVDYDKAGKVVMLQNGDMKGENRVQGQQNEFALDYPNEYITSVEGTCDLESGRHNRVRSLSFKTSKERTSPTYGNVGEQTFVLESKDRALVGFHGRAGWAIDAIGAYFGPPPVEKLQGKGGDEGASWDDGAFDGVRKIYVGQGKNGVANVKFVYEKNNQVVLGEDHGKRNMLGYEEFELEYPNEYITAVEGCYDKRSESTIITMLKFKTNVRISPAFGIDSTPSFVLEKEGHKIVGFHGKSSDELHQFGVSVAPLGFYKLPGYNKENLHLSAFLEASLLHQSVAPLGCFNKLPGYNMENPHLSDRLEVTLHRIDSRSREINEAFSDELFSILLRKLKVCLQAGTKVLADADQKAYDNQAVKIWLAEFQDASSNAENTLEDILEEALRPRVRRRFPLWMSNWFLNDDNLYPFLKRMEGVVSELEFLVRRIDMIGLRDCGRAVEAQWNPRSNISSPFHNKDYGRDADKLALTSLLLSGNIVSNGTPNVISVNGVPGIGKTTLVAVVYKDDNMTRHFDLKVWIYVGKSFDIIKVTKYILHKVTSVAANTDDLDSLQVQLMETLEGKRLLLVLDDFWSDNSSEWEHFLNAFAGVSKGSKIVLTTRSDNVTSITNAAQTYQLKLITNTESWELICRSIIGYESVSSIDQELESLGKRIAKQCEGLPFAATTIASHFWSNPNLYKWNDVSNNFLSNTTDVRKVLRQSYDSLPCHLKRCFAFCSIFPKGYVFDRQNLVLLWMAVDLLYQPGSNQRLEDIGNNYLDDLVSRSFFQSLDSKKRFTMHDLMNDLAKTVAGDLCFIVEDDTHWRKIPDSVRHLSICGSQFSFYKASTFTREATYLRTFLPLVCSPPRFEFYALPFEYSSQAKLRCLRILSLSHYQVIRFRFPKSFEGLNQLRYLDLSNAKIEEIPEFVFSLHNLQTLILSNCRQLRRLTTNIVHLINLRYLVLLWTPLVEMPRGISNLRSLQRLSNFVIGKLSGAGLQELRELSHLRGTLHISELQNVVSINEASDPGLKEKPFLKKLVLTWSVESSSSNSKACDQTVVLKMLQPHPNLEKVSINSYGGEIFPKWLGDTSFFSMTSVSLTSCSLCISLPPLGQLPNLRYLSIEKFKILQKVGLDFFYGEKDNLSPLESFPSLLNLSFYDMPIWEEWCCPELEGGIFPRLNKLTIRRCPSLNKLPKGLPYFTQVTISDSDRCEENYGKISEPSLSKKEELYGESKEQSRPEPGSSSEIYGDLAVASKPDQNHLSYTLTTLSNDAVSTSEEMMPQRDQDEMVLESTKVTKVTELRNLSKGLKRLQIESIRGLTNLPESLMKDYPDLQELVVDDCPYLEAFHGGYESFINLTTLYIRKCMNLEFIESLETMHNVPLLEDLFIGSSCRDLSSFPLASFPNLKSLTIKNCEKFICFTVARGDVCLALETFEITECPKMEFFAKGGLQTLKLASLFISNCNILKRLPEDLSAFTSLLSIHINECPQLEGIPSCGFPESLQTLCISRCQNLRPTLEWGLLSLCNLRDFEIEGGNDDIESFPNKELLPQSLYSLRISKFKNLRTLNGFEGLPNLGILEISGCDKFESLPDEGLPSSMSLLRINGSLLWKEKIDRKDFEWFKIKRIQRVEIDGEEFLRGRKKT